MSQNTAYFYLVLAYTAPIFVELNSQISEKNYHFNVFYLN